MNVAIGHVLIEIFKHVLAVWNTVYSIYQDQQLLSFSVVSDSVEINQFN
jgi:hypothetical protein